MIPTHNEAATRTASVTLQRKIESRAPHAAEAVGRAGCASHFPARHGGAGKRRALMADEKAKPATAVGCKRQAARRGEIGSGALFGEFRDDGRERARLERFLGGPQRID